jgi:hypothetical protein
VSIRGSLLPLFQLSGSAWRIDQFGVRLAFTSNPSHSKPTAPDHNFPVSAPSLRSLDKLPETPPLTFRTSPFACLQNGQRLGFGIPRQFLYSRYSYPIGMMPARLVGRESRKAVIRAAGSRPRYAFPLQPSINRRISDANPSRELVSGQIIEPQKFTQTLAGRLRIVN